MKTGKTLSNFLLVLAALALVVFLTVSFGLFSPSSHMWPSRVEDGRLHYTKHNCSLAYTPGEGSKLLSLPWRFGSEESPAAYSVGERSFTLSGDEAQLCCIDLETGEAWTLADEIDASLALTDGRWLYTYRMWGSGSASCWELRFDEGGAPSGLDYVGEV